MNIGDVAPEVHGAVEMEHQMNNTEIIFDSLASLLQKLDKATGEESDSIEFIKTGIFMTFNTVLAQVKTKNKLDLINARLRAMDNFVHTISPGALEFYKDQLAELGVELEYDQKTCMILSTKSKPVSEVI